MKTNCVLMISDLVYNSPFCHSLSYSEIFQGDGGLTSSSFPVLVLRASIMKRCINLRFVLTQMGEIAGGCVWFLTLSGKTSLVVPLRLRFI